MINRLGREVPESIEGYGICRSYPRVGDELQVSVPKKYSRDNQSAASKLRSDLSELIKEIGIEDGMTLSFHHHLRNGDKVLQEVIQAVSDAGLKDIRVAASSIFPTHACLVECMKNGVIGQVTANYISGPVADAISNGELNKPAIMYTHGGRARAIESGELQIDVAFIAAPACDSHGNISGAEGRAACGALGYAVPDAQYAQTVVAVTDNLVSYPTPHTEISEEHVDYVLQVECIGDPAGIVSGTTQITRDPIGLKIASLATQVIEASGLLAEGMSFQTGAGGTSLAVAHYLAEKMKDHSITGSFASGGITGYLVDMFEQGLFKSLLDVQCFDLEAIRSYRENPLHQGMSASRYGNPHNKGCVVNQLDVMILGATEIDLDFNVNVTTASDGRIMGGSGGHSDTAYGSKLAIVVTQLVKGRLPIVKKRVTTLTTPGSSIDVLVTERGIAVHPNRQDLKQRLEGAGLPVYSIEDLYGMACQIAGEPNEFEMDEKIVAVVEYRDGSVIDVIRKVKG